MLIGVVCEGPTDFHAIEAFFSHALSMKGITATFKAIQPNLDRTQPEGGWGNVLLWLKKNPPAVRVNRLFGGGLFGGGLARQKYDALLIQLDTDILGEASFGRYLKDEYGLDVDTPNPPGDRAKEVRRIIEYAADLESMANADCQRHVIAPAVESTEAWCVAAFLPTGDGYEALSGQNLTTSFMTVLERSEGKAPSATYAKIDKNPKRRKDFCDRHANGAARVLAGCPSFKTVYDDLLKLS